LDFDIKKHSTGSIDELRNQYENLVKIGKYLFSIVKIFDTIILLERIFVLI